MLEEEDLNLRYEVFLIYMCYRDHMQEEKKKKRISETYKIAGISYDYELQPSLITHITVDYWLCVKCFTGNKNIFR